MDLRVRTRCVSPLALGIVFTAFTLLPLASAQSTSGNSSQSLPWMNASLSPDERAALVLKQMTLDEKISLLHGTGMIGLSPMSPLAVRLEWRRRLCGGRSTLRHPRYPNVRRSIRYTEQR